MQTNYVIETFGRAHLKTQEEEEGGGGEDKDEEEEEGPFPFKT